MLGLNKRRMSYKTMGKRSGQSTLEYVIIFAVAAAVIITIAINLQPKLSGSFNTLDDRMDKILKKE